MNVILAGDCEKHDLALTLASLIRAYTEKTVTIITDEDENYRFFNGEVSGVSIDVEIPKSTDGFQIYDWHYGIPDVAEDSKILLVTSYEKRSIESINNIIKQLKDREAVGLVVIESEGRISLKYIEKSMSAVPSLTTSYFDSPSRRIDWVHDGRVNLKVDKDFASAVQDLLTQILEVPEKDLKKLWAYARKRG